MAGQAPFGTRATPSPVWDGARWVSPSGDAWWDGTHWQRSIRDLGGYTLTSDRKFWFDGQAWLPIYWRPSLRLIGLLIGLEVAALVVSLMLLVPTAWQFNCQFVSYAASHSCGVMNGLWLSWVGGALVGIVANVGLVTGIALLMRRRRSVMTPPALLALLSATQSPRDRRFLLVMLGVADFVTGALALFGLAGLAAVLTGVSPPVDSGTIVFMALLIPPFPIVLAATVAVAMRSSWALDLSVFAGVALSLTCFGLVFGIPIAVTALNATPDWRRSAA